MSSFFPRRLSALLVVAILATACTSSPVEASRSNGPAGPSGTVTVALHTFDNEALDKSRGQVNTLPYVANIYDWFVGATPSGELSTKYGVLEKYEASSDAKTWTLTLKKGIKWHDGVEITSDDVKFSIELYAGSGTQCTMCGSLRTFVSQVDVVDKYVTRISLKQPNVNIPAIFGPLEGDLMIMPKQYYERVGATEFREHPMGSGPWKFASRKIGEYIEFDANTEYWDSQRIPGFAKLRLVLIPESSTRVAMLKRGEVDLISVDPSKLAELQSAGFTIAGPKNSAYTLLCFAKSHDPAQLTNKLEFRKALALSVDWDKLVTTFYPPAAGTRYQGSGALFNPVSLGYDPTLPPYKYDVDEAKRQLSASGYKGEKVRYWSHVNPQTPEQSEVNQAIASYWRAAGITVEITQVDEPALRERWLANPQRFDDAPANIVAFAASPRPSVLGNMQVYMVSHEAGGILSMYWNVSKVDQLYRQLTATVNADDRNRILKAFNKQIYDEYWALPIVAKNGLYALGPRVTSWQPTDSAPTNLHFETLQPKR